jgi:GNAT superfamily N-acetyltransferase
MIVPKLLLEKGKVITRGSLKIIVIQNPNDEILGDLRSSVLTILGYLASRAFGRCVDLAEIEDAALLGKTQIFIAVSENKIVGFASLTAEPVENDSAQHLSGIAVSPDAIGLKIGEALLKEILETTKCTYLSMSTQNPILYNLLLKLGGQVYPSISGQEIPSDIGQIALLTKRGKSGLISATNLVYKAKYLYLDTFRWSRNMQVNTLFRDKLSFTEDHTDKKFYLIAKFE